MAGHTALGIGREVHEPVRPRLGTVTVESPARRDAPHARAACRAAPARAEPNLRRFPRGATRSTRCEARVRVRAAAGRRRGKRRGAAGKGSFLAQMSRLYGRSDAVGYITRNLVCPFI